MTMKKTEKDRKRNKEVHDKRKTRHHLRSEKEWSKSNAGKICLISSNVLLLEKEIGSQRRIRTGAWDE